MLRPSAATVLCPRSQTMVNMGYCTIYCWINAPCALTDTPMNSGVERNQMVSGYLPTRVVYLSKRFHSMWFPLRLNVRFQQRNIMEVFQPFLLIFDQFSPILRGIFHQKVLGCICSSGSVYSALCGLNWHFPVSRFLLKKWVFQDLILILIPII